ncbi:hypothetical protein BCR42DRAFT_401437 [Absidia repens]|uniref:Galactose oxidase n=1 Tax=Absidia repens TaxID=90262 RepID=A0A1X2J2G2_9FUNG|nr:hypothetical protein BCR42DRAFT_401437 [Absidia repens]
MIVSFVFLSLLFINHAYAISGRVLQECTTLGNNIYCYGGYLSAASGVFTNITTAHITTDMSKIDLSAASASPTWSMVPAASANAPGPSLEPRAALGMTALDDTRYMILGGGHGSALNTPGAIFDSGSNSWTALPEPPFYMSEGAMIASDANTVLAYGGKLNSTPNYTPSNLLKLDLSVAPGTWTILPAGQGSPPISRYGYEMVFRNGIIYFFGGFLDLPETNLQPNIVPLFNVTWYNTATDQWGTIQSTGDKISPRKDHTATLIEGTNKVLIYGGTNIANLQALPVSDYSFIYDLDDHTYKQIDLSNGGGAGPRVGHSAISYKQTVFILFGYDGSGNILSDTHVLDVSNPNAPTWAGASQNNNPNPGNSTDPPIHGDSSTGLATGAIAGIVVGVVAALAIAGALGFIFYRKRRNQNNNEFDYYVPPPQDFTTDVTPTMFPENNDKYHNQDQQQQSDTSNDPVPTYPTTKPHDNQPESVMMEQMPKVKPAAND